MNHCGTCRHSEPEVLINEDETDVVLCCRRYPPHCFMVGEQPMTVWPQVEESDCCGEWSDGSPLLRPVQRAMQLLGFRP